jgi:hypothetical protein
MAEARRLNPGAGHPCRPHFFCHEDSPTAVGLSVLDLRGNCQALPFDGHRICQQAKPGALAVSNTDPVFLVINSKGEKRSSVANPAAICLGQAELMHFIKSWGPGQTWTVIELGTSVHALASALAKSVPRRRGRGKTTRATSL